MSDKLKIELGEVQQTLLFPLLGRAREYESANPLIKDSLAHELVGKLDFDFGSMTDSAAQLQINCSVRTYNFDAAIRALIETHPDATIVNLGCGLDTTFQRVDNGRIFWYDLDFEDTIALRRRLLPEGDRNKLIPKSLFDRSWFADIRIRGSKIFFMCAGVLAYLKEEDIRGLFLDLSREFPGSEMMFEIYSKRIIWLKNRSVEKQRRNGEIVTQLRWGAGSAEEIAKWGGHIGILGTYPFYSKVELDAHWAKRDSRPLKLIRLLGWMKMVHLKLGA